MPQANDAAAANDLGNARVIKSLRSILKNREGHCEANIEMPVPELTSFAQYYRWFMAEDVVGMMTVAMVRRLPGIVIIPRVVIMAEAMSIVADVNVGMIASFMLMIKSAHAKT